MPDGAVYDTRFFVDLFFSDNSEHVSALKKDLRGTRKKIVPTAVIHEFYRLNLERAGREVADLRCEAIRQDSVLAYLDYEIAILSARIRLGREIPMADSVIAATAQCEGYPVVTNDPHFKLVPGIKTRWPR